MARSKQKQTYSQQLMGMATIGMPPPVRAVATSRSGARFLLLLVPILLATGVLTVSFSGGLPQFSINQERAQAVQQQVTAEATRVAAEATRVATEATRSGNVRWSAGTAPSARGEWSAETPRPGYTTSSNSTTWSGDGMRRYEPLPRR